MLSKRVLDSLLELCVSTGGDFAEIFCETSRHTNILALSDRVESSSCGRESGVGIRIFHGLNSIYAFTTDKSQDNLTALAKQAAAAIKTARRERLPLGDICVYGKHEAKLLPHTISYASKMDLIKRTINAGMNYSAEIVQMAVRYLDMEQRVQIANSEGLFAEDTRVKTRMLITAYAQSEKGLQSGYIGPGAMRGYEFYEDLDIEWFARESARSALTMLNARKCPARQTTVVVENGFGGLMFHEACGHSLEASSVAKGTSEFAGKLGKQIASPLVTLIDDGTIPNAWGSLSVDDEGMPTQKNVLIKDGILQGFMIDKLNGRRLGMKPSGSARRQSYRFAPIARMTNTYIANGASTKQEIIGNTESGLFVKNINGGSVNPTTGDFNFNVSEAYLIDQGKITEPVRGATLIGNGGNILRQVDMVGNNLDIGQGYCYAGSGTLFIGAGQPTVRVANMTVGGVE